LIVVVDLIVVVGFPVALVVFLVTAGFFVVAVGFFVTAPNAIELLTAASAARDAAKTNVLGFDLMVVTSVDSVESQSCRKSAGKFGTRSMAVRVEKAVRGEQEVQKAVQDQHPILRMRTLGQILRVVPVPPPLC
jgi:hypothetical protein